MKTKLPFLVAVFVLLLSVTLIQKPVHAHIFDRTALWSCASQRISRFTEIDHASPVYLGSGWVEYWCREHNRYYTQVYAYRVVLYVSSGVIRRFTGRIDCTINYCQENVTP